MIARLGMLRNALWRTLDSVGGRTFLLLTIGITSAAVLSLAVTEGSRRRDFETLRIDQLTARTLQIQRGLAFVSSDAERDAFIASQPGARLQSQAPTFRLDESLKASLTEAMGAVYRATGGPTAQQACLPPGTVNTIPSDLGNGFHLVLTCWIVQFTPPGERTLTISMFQPPVIMPFGSTLNPLYLAVLLIASAGLSVLVARFVTLPLRRLTNAATAFADSLDAEDADVRGPSEVKAALSTFNIMQARVRAGLRERTQLLAAISHDLQTPLTRLRLRIEQVQDDAVRERLVTDVNAMQQLVREGLDLARSQESAEPWSVVHIDSLVQSLADDAAEFGQDVRFVGGCGASLRVKPNALARALNNLIDNAIAYGGGAEVDCTTRGERIEIRIRDRGPGLTDPDDERLFEPFVRGEANSTSPRKGTGIGLTIARAQAATSGATLKLANHPAGGLVATVSLRRGLSG